MLCVGVTGSEAVALFAIERRDEMCVVGEYVNEQTTAYCCRSLEGAVLCLKRCDDFIDTENECVLWSLTENRGLRLQKRKAVTTQH